MKINREIYNIFPTTIYVGEMENHKDYKTRFDKLYSKYDYEQKSVRDGEQWFNTTSENTGKPYIHLEESLSELPNQLADDVPEGSSDLDNIELRSEGIIKPRLYQPKDHVELVEKLEEIDFDSAIKISGARFVVLRGQLARLERALANFMLSLIHI